MQPEPHNLRRALAPPDKAYGLLYHENYNDDKFCNNALLKKLNYRFRSLSALLISRFASRSFIDSRFSYFAFPFASPISTLATEPLK